MQIIKQGAGNSTAFIIQSGKQLTLFAQGLAEDDYVEVEVVTLSRAPEFSGNPCCDMAATEIEVIGFAPLMCAPSSPVRMTADIPYVIIDAPQMVTLRAVVHASPAALVSVELFETDSDGSASLCRCLDETWTQSGEIRCTATKVEAKEVSNCGTIRWVETGPVVWTQTGTIRCTATKVEAQEINDCGATRWTETGPITWTPTGETRCANNLVEAQEANDCGVTRWAVTATACGFCPSMRLSCDGSVPGFGFHDMDVIDPLATVEMAPCAGDTTTDRIRIYPSAGPGHTVKITDCDGVLVGYAANRSDCAPDCGCPKDPVINIKTYVAAPEVTNNFAPTTNVAAPEVTNNFAPTTNVSLPAPNLVAHALSNTGVLTSTLSDGSTVTSNPLPTC